MACSSIFFLVERTKGIVISNLSKRQQELKKMVKELERRRNLCAFRYLMDFEDNVEDNIDKMMEVMYQTAITKWYMFRRSSNWSKPCHWKALLQNKHLLNEREFVHAFQMSRSSFHSLLNMLNTHDTASADYKEMFPVCLLMLLKLGSKSSTFLFSSSVISTSNKESSSEYFSMLKSLFNELYDSLWRK